MLTLSEICADAKFPGRVMIVRELLMYDNAEYLSAHYLLIVDNQFRENGHFERHRSNVSAKQLQQLLDHSRG